MNFPHFQVPWLGNGMVIGLNATIHVFLSHGYAFGLVFMIALAELIGFRKRSAGWDSIAYSATIPAVVGITSVSAVTGVGIWFTIGVLAPRAAASMLRLFFWPWFIEWTIFVAEAVIIVAFYLSWKSLDWPASRKRWHIALGFLYPALGWGSAWLITGILGFMLTPDGWPAVQRRHAGFFNPSLWPQTWLRFFGGLALGALIMCLIIFFRRRQEPSVRREAVRLYGFLFIGFAVACGFCVWWYFSQVPQTYYTFYRTAMLTSHIAQSPWVVWLVNSVALVVLFAFAIMAVLKLWTPAKVLIVPALIMGAVLVAEFERVREFIRGPFLMPGYMWANQILLREAPELQRTGTLARSWWYNAAYPNPTASQSAQQVFGNNCITCHTIGGLNDIRDRLKGRTEDAVYVLLGHTNQIAPFMPPFTGTDAERRLMASYLYGITNRAAAGVPPVRYPQRREELYGERSH